MILCLHQGVVYIQTRGLVIGNENYREVFSTAQLVYKTILAYLESLIKSHLHIDC